jgi:DNA-binding NarL/FixJ family response regulator
MSRVLIADPQPIVRQAVREAIEARPGWRVCAETCDGSTVLSMALEQRPDIAVVAVSLPGLDGVAVTRQLKQTLPTVRVVVLTVHDDLPTISRALAAGAQGYVLKTDNQDVFAEALAAAAEHRPYLSPVVSDLLLETALA